ncbi:electron transfer flavoprotein subunit alpha/FixB family protein [Candidatus Bathyarchaeota archaeon]|nr:electron transfer flavoprotein subunit alpha/FixB family protein [Candidatus Bathyarchaeota archaeon]
MTGILVYSEDLDLQLQLLSKGRELSNNLAAKLYALVIGSNVEGHVASVLNYSDAVITIENKSLEHYDVELYKIGVVEAVKRVNPDVILIGATKFGKELAARTAAALDAGCMTECISLNIDKEGNLLAERLIYGGSSIALEKSRRKPHIAVISKNIFKRLEPSTKVAEVLRLDTDHPKSKVQILEKREKSKSDTGLEEASIIVAAGRGFKKKEDLDLLRELSSILGSKIGCTRPISADNGWLDEWIGISGKKVKPRLYIAFGISGTIQHAAGIRGSQIIVSVNQDEAAGIFEISDYGILGDLYTILPALIKVLKKVKKTES